MATPMTTRIDSRLSRLLHGGREAAIEELGRLADENPAAFLELLGLLLDQADRATAAPAGPIQFVFTQQPGSNNRT
jgi:hypothetical protein